MKIVVDHACGTPVDEQSSDLMLVENWHWLTPLEILPQRRTTQKLAFRR
jgi:hypothetical protein